MLTENSNAMDTLIAGYAAGALPTPLHALVEAHLEMSPVNRSYAADLEVLRAAELDDVNPAKMMGRDAFLEQLFHPDHQINTASSCHCNNTEASLAQAEPTLPRSLARYLNLDLTDIPWKSRLMGVREHKVGEIDGCNVSMFWLKAGTGVPTHTHGGAEVTLVLHGGYSDGLGHYVRGDLAYADDSVDHRPVADDDGDCIGIAVTDAPLKLTGPVGRILNPLLRF